MPNLSELTIQLADDLEGVVISYLEAKGIAFDRRALLNADDTKTVINQIIESYNASRDRRAEQQDVGLKTVQTLLLGHLSIFIPAMPARRISVDRIGQLSFLLNSAKTLRENREAQDNINQVIGIFSVLESLSCPNAGKSVIVQDSTDMCLRTFEHGSYRVSRFVSIMAFGGRETSELGRLVHERIIPYGVTARLGEFFTASTENPSVEHPVDHPT